MAGVTYLTGRPLNRLSDVDSTEPRGANDFDVLANCRPLCSRDAHVSQRAEVMGRQAFYDSGDALERHHD